MNFELKCVAMCLLLASALPSRAQTAPEGIAVAVELAVPFGTVPGKLLLLGKYMVFLDEQQPGASFVVGKSGIESLNADGMAITVQSNEAVRNRSGEQRRLSFRLLAGGDPAVVTSWYGGGVAPSSSSTTPSAAASSTTAPAVSSATAAGPTTYQARHNHRFGDCRGRLLVGPDLVSYESVSSVSHSQRWEYQAIKEAKLPNPYELEIKPFIGDSYKFQFDGAGMDPASYRELVDRVTSARAKR